MGVVGILSVVFGFGLLGNAIASALAPVFVIAIFAIVCGIVLLIHIFHVPETPALPT